MVKYLISPNEFHEKLNVQRIQQTVNFCFYSIQIQEKYKIETHPYHCAVVRKTYPLIMCTKPSPYLTFSSFFHSFHIKYGPKLGDFIFLHFATIARRKNGIKYYVGGSLRWICRAKVTKNRMLKNHLPKKSPQKIGKDKRYVIQGHL